MEQFLGGLQILLNWQNFLIIPVGLVIGIVVGAIPGLTSDLGIILCIPLTYGMDPTMAILMLLAIYCGGTYGGSITAILINTPGTSANAATLFDGYPMTVKGQAFKALQMALYASTIGGLISAFSLLFLAPLIAKITLLFGPAEYFALAVFGLSVIAGVSNDSIFKGLIAACLGLFMTTIGVDSISGTARFLFGQKKLMAGIDLIIALIGMFAISEILTKSKYDPKTDHKIYDPKALTKDKITKEEYRRCRKPIGIGSLVGVIIGATPGTGGGLAAFIAYNQVKQASKHPETFGKGEIEGVAVAESANNGACGATMIPMLTLGVPGDGATAILMGAFMLHGMVPGPSLFAEQGNVLYAIMLGLLVVNVFMYIVGTAPAPHPDSGGAAGTGGVPPSGGGRTGSLVRRKKNLREAVRKLSARVWNIKNAAVFGRLSRKRLRCCAFLCGCVIFHWFCWNYCTVTGLGYTPRKSNQPRGSRMAPR